MKRLFACLLFAAVGLHALAQTVLREWDFGKGDLGWSPGLMKALHVEGGALVFDTEPGDVMFVSPVFDPIPATPWQQIELTMKSEVSGPAEFFWTNTTETQYQGFSPGKETGFDIVGGEEKTYRIHPFWQAEKQIIRLRLDLPERQGGRYLLRSIRVVEEAPPEVTSLPVPNITLDKEGEWWARVSLKAQDFAFVTLRLSVQASRANASGALYFASSAANGMHAASFPLRTDRLMHTYNVDVGANAAWKGEIVALRLKLAKEAGAKVESISTGQDAQGPADLEVTYFGFREAVARAGKPVGVVALVRNLGGEPAQRVKAKLSLAGANVLREESAPEAIEFGVPETFAWVIQADHPGQAQAALAIEGMAPVKATLDFTPSPKLPKMPYVPEPKPANSDYQVGVYYFPGWATSAAWEPIKRFPERQPLLGWYREGEPEVADWQIKWAVEHGISFFLYDWYWDRGGRSLEHGLHSGLFKARYQNLLKFCLLWANHNGAGSHSAEDFEKVTRYWIENYFKRPNYLKLGGRPVIVFFAAMNPVHDMGKEKVRESFDRMRAMCKEAGLGGLYLVACGNSDPNLLRTLKEVGYDAVSGYNWPGVNMTAEESAAHRSPFEKCAAGYVSMWQDIVQTNALKLIPPVSGGWDSRPWHGDGALNRYDRTPEAFRQHLLDCKRFLDEREQAPKLKMLFIEAWNEWGEGSYIEPQREFGFGYLEAIRQVFAPNSPKPDEFLPVDVGLGPYDLPDQTRATEWRFGTEGDKLGWSGNVGDLRVEGGALCFTTHGHDPILSGPAVRVRAGKFPFVVFRLKASRDLDGQLFWSTATSAISEGNSVHFPLKGDGQFHETKVRLADNPRWRGIITGLRFDPGSEDGVEVEVEAVRLVEE